MMMMMAAAIQQLQQLSIDNTTCYNWQDALLEFQYPPWQWTPTNEDRTPLLTFRLSQQAAGSMLSSNSSSSTTIGSEQLYGVYMFNSAVWLSILVLIFGAALVALPTAFAVYYLIVKPQKNVPKIVLEQNSNGHQPATMNGVPPKGTSGGPRRREGTTWMGYALGWLVLVPAWIFLPVVLLDQYVSHVDHLLVRFAVLVITPTITLFRVTEALYGFSPSYATKSLGSFCLYFCFPLPMVHDKNDEPVRCAAVTPYLFRFLGRLILTGLYQSLLVSSRGLVYFPYGKGPTMVPDHYFDWESLIDPKIIWDTFAMALLFQLYLSTFGVALQMFTTVITGGLLAEINFQNPMLSADSITDFWGRRWNLAIHRCLKDGVYKPVRALGGSPALAITCAFTASGLFHEWLLPNVFSNYPNTHGVTLIFFWWQAGLLILEGTGIGRIGRNWPRILKTVCVISLGIPVGHWFVDSYWRSQFFVHAELLFPMILPIDNIDSTLVGI